MGNLVTPTLFPPKISCIECGSFKQMAGKHPVSQIFFLLTWFFSKVQTLKYKKYAWGLIPDGMHGDPCQLPD